MFSEPWRVFAAKSGVLAVAARLALRAPYGLAQRIDRSLFRFAGVDGDTSRSGGPKAL